MGCQISHQRWFEYLEGTLEAPARRLIEDHLTGCPSCAALVSDIRRWETRVEHEAASLAAAVSSADSRIDVLFSQSLRRLQDFRPQALTDKGPLSSAEALRILRALLDPICGSGAARSAIRLAVAQSCPPDMPRIAAGNWPLFIANLSSAVAPVYGSFAGTLVRRVGDQLDVETY